MVIELNVALIPNQATANELISISSLVAKRYSTIVQLEEPLKLSLAPHLTLYQLPVDITRLQEAEDNMSIIAAHTNALTLAATKYAFNDGEASFELQRETTNELVRLQTELLEALNLLRGERLLTRDPSGAIVADMFHADEPLGANIRDYGYAEVGSLFRPHDTLNWLRPNSTITVDTSQLPNPQTISGRYDALGLFALGPHGTCAQLLTKTPLREDQKSLR